MHAGQCGDVSQFISSGCSGLIRCLTPPRFQQPTQQPKVSFFLYFTRQTSQAQSMPTVFIERPQHSSEHNGESFGIHTLGEFACLRECRIWGSRSESSGLSSLPTPRGGSGPASLDEGSDNGRPTDTDSPFDLSLARWPPHQHPCHFPASNVSFLGDLSTEFQTPAFCPVQATSIGFHSAPLLPLLCTRTQ